jgi:arylesterase/paraoxonase
MVSSTLLPQRSHPTPTWRSTISKRDSADYLQGAFKPEKSTSDHGGLYIYDYASPNLPDTDRLRRLDTEESDIHPLGLAFDTSSSTLYVVNHSRHRGSHILIFHINTKTYATTLVARFTHPLLHAPNSIQVLGPHQLYVTNDHYIRAATASILSKIETFSGAPGGSVVYVDTRFPKSAKVVARVPFANGITSVNETTLAVASSSKSGVYLFGRKENHELELKRIIRTPAAVDNLSADSGGKVLMAGHPFGPGLIKMSKGRWKCDEHGSQEERAACACSAPSWVAEWSEEGWLREVYKDDGREFCSSSTFVRDSERGLGIVSGLYERGILVFQT